MSSPPANTLCHDCVPCHHQIQASLSLLQSQEEALKFSHGFYRSRSVDKITCLHFRRFRKKSLEQLHFLTVARLPQIKLVVNSSRTQQGLIQLLDMVGRHYKQNTSWRVKTV